MEETLQLALQECFKLGRALRMGDADAFCELYDSLLPGDDQDDGNLQFKFSAIKEAARQISELSQEDFITLNGCYTPIQNLDFSLDIFEPIATQLAALIDQLRMEKQACTSDSGALSDYESSVCGTEGHKSSGSNSLITVCGEETELVKELEELGIQSDADASTAEKDCATDAETVTPSSPCTEAAANEITPNGQSNTACHQLSSDKSSVRTPDSVQKKSEEKDREIGDLLSRIKSMSPEEASKLETHNLSPEEVHPPSNNSDVILVSDLEKELFSDSSEDVSPEKSTREQRIGKSRGHHEQSRVGRETPRWHRDGGPTYGSRYNNRRGYRQRYRGRGFRSYPRKYRNDDDTENRSYTPHDTGGSGAWASRKSEDKAPHREIVSNESNNCNKESSEYTTRKGRQGRGGQLSPLVHSQNMWSSPRRGTYRQRRHCAQPPDNTFNHYEVGCFLMEGWEQAKKEMAEGYRAAL